MITYREITMDNEWLEAIEATMDKPMLILKHSTRCSVSSAALEEYESYLADRPRSDIDYILVKVIESRPISNRIAAELEVKHESPQMILVKQKTKYWATSHWSITKKHMQAVLD